MSESVKITPMKMVIFSVGWLGANFFWGFHSGSFPLFLNDFTNSKFKISLILSSAGAAGCLIPPVVGYLSDRTHSRLGRRKPYMLLGMLGTFFCLLALPYMDIYAFVAPLSILMYLCINVAETPYMAMMSDITPQSRRSSMSGVMHLVGSIGLITFFVISSRIWESHQTLVFHLVAAVLLGSIIFTIALTKEPETPELKPTKGAGALAYLKGLAEEREILKFYTAQFMWWLGFITVVMFITLFLSEELNVSEDNSLLAPMASSISAMIFVLPISMLGDRYGRKRVLSYVILAAAVTELLIGFSQNLTQALITVALSGIPFGASMGVGYAFLLDLIPKERTAEFVGFEIVSISLAMILGPLISGRLIDVFGYRSIFPVASAFIIIGFVILQFIHPPQECESPK